MGEEVLAWKDWLFSGTLEYWLDDVCFQNNLTFVAAAMQMSV